MQLANREIPVLMLDAQMRPLLGVQIDPDNQKAGRDALIDAAIAANTARHEALWELGKVQSYDQHDLAYFCDVLHRGDARMHTVELSDCGFTRGAGILGTIIVHFAREYGV